ncbi:hypothetical protein PF007_g6011 [Phytophthora fragariae]|uniref:Uncharacterized protein n=1 Tax=Phytophthora fragariae TaxID=53985 RepID=A0A6A3SXV9_9STRA|nr:hypothetical protein PF009_g6124 [Phytophthora fragariae]KAE9126345.1 hypothetical protein PF007_g6011 [Phytophthora fragariae]
MAESSRYALFKPDVLETVGYAYGRATSTERQGVYDVERLASGRWVDLGAFATQRGAAEVERRGVTEEEALSGIGTYVGSALCVARVPPGKPKVWDYGVVAGYTWCDRTITGTLQITFIEGTSNVAFVKEELQDLAIATYALRPCQMRGTADIMPAEMRSLHAAAHGHFNGVGEPARRSSTTVLKKLTMNLIDESQAVPVYNLDKTRIEFLKIEHILNYVFYQEGRRRAPQGMDVAASLFAPDAEPGRADDHGPHGHNSTDAERMYQHYDSDDDLAPAEPSRGDRPSERAKRGRDELPVEAASNQRDSRLTALRRRLEDDPEMVRDIVQLIAFRQSNLSNGSASSLVNTATTEPKSQFRSSRQQGIVHGAMTNGKYLSLDAQLFVETMQSQANIFDYLPHPGVARGFYGWDFGFRGLTIRHFAPMDVEVEREYLRRYDMTDFSSKNKLPEPQRASDLADVLAALEVLSVLVSEMYVNAVVELVDAARRFLLLLRKTKSMQGPEAVPELVAWIDDRFESFRSCLAREYIVAAEEVKSHFQFNHESYARVVQRVTNLKVEAALRSPATQKPAGRQSKLKQRGSSSSSLRSGRGISVPTDVVAALPIRKGKKTCCKRIAGRSVGPTWLKVTEEALFCRCKTIAGRLFGPSWLTVTTEASFCRRKRITGRQTGAWWLKVTEKTLFGRCQPQDNTPLG